MGVTCACGEVIPPNRFKRKFCSNKCRLKALHLGNKKINPTRSNKLYQIYCWMKSRCLNKKTKSYRDYGGRGITICAEWFNSPAAFQKWATEKGGYRPGLTIERIDVNAGYSPENCVFITKFEQAANKRNNKALEAFGEVKHLSAWARDSRCVISMKLLSKRIIKGMTPEEAMTKPSRVVASGRHS